jgi:hypothetical protein
MAKRSLLRWLDEGNQRAMDHVRARPESGLKTNPYLKSESSRPAAVALMTAVMLAGLIFGWIGGVIALVLAAPFLWRLEHHFFFTRSQGSKAPSTDTANDDSPQR